MTTVFMLGGGYSGVYNYMPAMLQGNITTNNTQIQIPYNNCGFTAFTVGQGAELLNSYLNQGTDDMVVFGHSLGAVVASYWLCTYAQETSIEPADLSFVFIGNSVSTYGGALGPETGALYPNWFGDITITATPYAVTDIKRQYDGWTDWPTGTLNTDAEYNALAGQNLVHPKYQNINPSPTAFGNAAHTEGNITYVWALTQPLPMLGDTWNTVVDGLDASLRPTVEQAYNRPVAVPSPQY